MRKPRVQFEGGLYHVITRGNQGQKVFVVQENYERYLKLVGEKLIPHQVKLYAYCLMPNHIHLLVEQGSSYPLSRFMQRLQTAYTSYFNRKYKKIGHLFQGRYKAILVEKGEYLLELVRYIHLNPIRAHLEERLGQYRWTSHGQYLGREKGPLAPVGAQKVLAQVGGRNPRKNYLRFVLEGQKQGHRKDLYDVSGWQVLGSEGFEHRAVAKVGHKSEGPLRLRMTVAQVWVKIKGREKLNEEPRGRERSRLLAEAAWVAVEACGASQTEVGRYFGMEQSGVSRALRRLEEQWRMEPTSRKRMMAWAGALKKS
jgi:REP element-mobilizing transposase RayT